MMPLPQISSSLRDRIRFDLDATVAKHAKNGGIEDQESCKYELGWRFPAFPEPAVHLRLLGINKPD
jgi:hypothetical protein